MFWQSVHDGLLNLLNWHILVGMLAVSSVCFAWPLLSAALLGSAKSGTAAGAGCVFLLLGPLVQSVAVTAFIVVCLPALVGGPGFTAGPLVGALAWPALRTAFFALVGVLLICLIPVLGGFIEGTPGVPMFLQGIFILKPVIQSLFAAVRNGAELPDSAFPTFWHSVGYALIGAVLCWLSFLAITLLRDAFNKRWRPHAYFAEQAMAQYGAQETSSTLLAVGMFVGPIFGILPLLMYGRYVGLALKALP